MSGNTRGLWLVSVVVAMALSVDGYAQTKPGVAGSSHWVGTWASSPQLAADSDLPRDVKFTDVTIRQVVQVSIGGSRVRLRISNAFGTAPLHISTIHFALSAGSGAIREKTDHELSFQGRASVAIPAGALAVSDELDFELPPRADVAITMHVVEAPATITCHSGSRTTSYVQAGDAAASAAMSQAIKVDHWYFINGIDIDRQESAAASVVVLGDSITDGRGSTTNGNDRWPDLLSRKLISKSLPVGVLNEGIGGNRLLRDGLGPNALARFDRDVLAQTVVRWLIVLEGVNDLGTRIKARQTKESWATADDIIGAYAQIVTRAHAHGIKVYGGTITPFMGSFYSAPDSESDRQKINDWIRHSGAFDGVIDFDKAVRDPGHPEQLLPRFDTGDHLHPSIAGYRAMADAVPTSIFGVVAGRTTLKIAFTFDDLPAHSALPRGVTRLEVATKIVNALHAAGLPPVYGFMNGALVEEVPDDAKVLEMWRAAGHPLGNHTSSHINLNQHTVQEFEGDVQRNESLLQHYMNGADWHWFRFPYLADGETPEKHAAVRKFLADRRYKIAAVTMSFSDYLWNEPYARCRDKSDEAAVAMLKATYLAAADDNIHYYRELSRTALGRDIPYVLLMHIGAFDAEMLPDLLELYRSRGFQFVSLAEAERDAWYQPETNPRLPSSTDTLEGAMGTRHLPIPPHSQPGIAFDTICR